jgi:hypothetical protein
MAAVKHGRRKSSAYSPRKLHAPYHNMTLIMRTAHLRDEDERLTYSHEQSKR